MMKYIYVTESDVPYGTVNGTFKKLADAFSTMTDTDKGTLFASLDDGVATVASLAILGRFQAYAWWQGENAIGIARPSVNGTGDWIQTEQDGQGVYTPHCYIEAVPVAQVVLPKGLLPLDGVSAIVSADVVTVTNGDGAVHLAVTTDLTTYKTYDFENSAWKDVDVTNAETFHKEGIESSKLSAIPSTAWDELGLDGLAFAYVLDEQATGDLAAVSKIALTLTMNGRWDEALNGTDYHAGYTSPTNLNVIFLQNGSYKINYTDGGEGDATSTQIPFGLANLDVDTWAYVDTKGDNI